MPAEQVAGDDEGNDGNDGGNEQLPRPEVALKEEGNGGEKRGNDAADGLGAEVQNDARHETAEANEQALIGTVALREDAGKTHRHTAHTAGKADKYPHHEYDVLLQCATARTFVVLVEEVYHQRCTNQWNAQPQPFTPVFVPQLQCKELDEEHDSRRVTPSQKQVLTRQLLAVMHLATDLLDDIQFLPYFHCLGF